MKFLIVVMVTSFLFGLIEKRNRKKIVVEKEDMDDVKHPAAFHLRWY